MPLDLNLGRSEKSEVTSSTPSVNINLGRISLSDSDVSIKTVENDLGRVLSWCDFEYIKDVGISFLDLTDTPSSYNLSNGKYLIVNPDGTGIEFTDVPPGGAVWGSITGNIEDQLDLMAKFDEKADLIHTHKTSEVLLDDDITANVDVGGISDGDTIAKDEDLYEILKKLLTKWMDAYVGLMYGMTLMQSGLSDYMEVGTQISATLSTTATSGKIMNGDDSQGPAIKGPYDDANFSGPYVDVYGNISGPVSYGNNKWTASIWFDDGIGKYYDSDGVESHTLDYLRVSETLAESTSITGIYPFLYGMSSTDIFNDQSTVFTDLSKDATPFDTEKFYDIQGTDGYIYFILPETTYTAEKIFDGNMFDVTQSFTYQDIIIDSGYSTNTYRVYKTINITTVDPVQTYKLKLTQ